MQLLLASWFTIQYEYAKIITVHCFLFTSWSLGDVTPRTDTISEGAPPNKPFSHIN